MARDEARVDPARDVCACHGDLVRTRRAVQVWTLSCPPSSFLLLPTSSRLSGTASG